MREGTKSALESDVERIKLVKNIILEHFSASSEILKELNLYKMLQETKIEENLAEKFVKEVQSRYEKLNKKNIFNEQTALINKINKSLGARVYDSFVPNYKNLATIYQIFNDSTPVKEKILLEQTIIDKIKIVQEEKEKDLLQPIDNILYKTFSKKFNEKYVNLLSEQKELLTKYINSFENNGIDLKVYLNEEIERLKKQVKESLKKEEIKSDPNMVKSTEKTLNYLNSFKEIKDLSEDMLQKVLKIQQFVHEVEN